MAKTSAFGAVGSALANADFRRYTSGNVFSHVGIWVQRIAVGWLAWELTQSPFWLGMIAFADFAPSVAVAPLAGAVADRIERLKAIKFTQSLGGLQAAALAVLVWTDTITIWLLFWLSLALGIVMAFNQPLRLAAIPSLVPRKDLAAAVSINSLSYNAARVVGPALAGYIIVAWDMVACFAIAALSYFVFVAALLMMRTRTQAPSGPRKPVANLPAEIMEGIRYSARHAGIAPMIVLMTVIAVLGRAYTELLPGFAADVFGRGAEGLAMLTSSMGAGAIVGGLYLASRSAIAGLTRVVVLNVLAFSVVLAAFALAPDIWIGMGLIAVSGFVSIVVGVGEQTLLQSAVEHSMRGRVMSLYGMIARAGPSIGALLVGGISEIVGLRWPVLGGAAACFLLWLWLRPRQRIMAKALEGEPAAEKAGG